MLFILPRSAYSSFVLRLVFSNESYQLSDVGSRDSTIKTLNGTWAARDINMIVLIECILYIYVSGNVTRRLQGLKTVLLHRGYVVAVVAES